MKKLGSFILACAFACVLTAMGTGLAFADESSDRAPLRVLFPQTEGFSMTDEDGTHHGLVVDYLNEIAKYTGWEYEFVDGDVDSLIGRLRDGEIDLVGGMFVREQLVDSLDYSTYSMGSNRSLLACAQDNDAVASFDLSTLNGATIGVYEKAVDTNKRLAGFLSLNGLSCPLPPLD